MSRAIDFFAYRIRFSLKYLVCILPVVTTVLILGAAPMRGQGWVKTKRPGLVTLDSGKRNPVFMVGEPIQFSIKGNGAINWEVRGFEGDILDRGTTGDGTQISIKPQPPGWYKLYVYGSEAHPPFGTEVGGTTFVVFRKKSGFPDLPPKGTPYGSYPAMDEPMRGVTGMGPQRHAVDANKPDESIRKLEADIELDKTYYLPYDPLRKRALMVAFPNGTKNLDGVRKIVEHFKNDVEYWEPRNEPNGGSTGANFVVNEMKPFYETVKSVDPKLKVLGPGTVSIGPFGSGLNWIEDFLKADGGKYIDAFSFHAYNTVNGDLWLARKGMDSLKALLAKYGLEKIEKWQTEQGFFAAMYGSYQPGHQARWTTLEMMVYEQYGIPKEHNHLWYDRSHGFWEFPTWWENEDGSLNPAAPLMRVWSEELYGTRFAHSYDLGANGNTLYLGSIFTGPGKRVAAFQSAGSTDGHIEIKVSSGSKLHIVSAFGVESDLPVRAGKVDLPVPQLPVYVEPTKDQQITPIPIDFGPNLALQAGVTASASGTGQHPLDKRIDNNIKKIINGVYENWYWNQQRDTQPWMDDTKGFPAWVEIDLPSPQKVSRVLVFSGNPWQWMASLLDYELQVDQSGKWVTVDRVSEPARTIKVYTSVTRTTVDSFATDRWIFQHSFKPVVTSKIRLLVHDTTWGGGATQDVVMAGGQTGAHQIMLREVEIYAK